MRFEAETNKQCQRENRDRELRGLDGFVTRLLEGPLKVFAVIGLRNWAQDERVGRSGGYQELTWSISCRISGD